MKKFFVFLTAVLLLTSTPIAPVYAGPETAQTCPVSGDPVKGNKFTAEYAGKNYSFCCKGCARKFTKNPSKYISA